jgi:rubrerythrin
MTLYYQYVCQHCNVVRAYKQPEGPPDKCPECEERRKPFGVPGGDNWYRELDR